MADLAISDLFVNILVIAVSFIVLNYASNLALKNALKVSTITQLAKTAVGFSLIAFSTSLPELTVALIAVLSGGAPISVGNVLGSNIVNVCLVIGLASILLYLRGWRRAASGKEVKLKDEDNCIPSFAKSELSSIYFGLFISSVIPMILIYVSAATWVVGLILLFVFVGYMYRLTKVRLPAENGEVTIEEKSKLKRYIIYTILGALGVVASAYFLVESASGIAMSIGIPPTVIGATIVAVGTSLPELTLDLKSFLSGHSALAFGDIIGSSFMNITLILGITLTVPALIGNSFTMDMHVFQNLMIFSIITNLFFWYFLSKEKIGWREGVIFLFIYALFLISTLGIIQPQ